MRNHLPCSCGLLTALDNIMGAEPGSQQFFQQGPVAIIDGSELNVRGGGHSFKTTMKVFNHRLMTARSLQNFCVSPQQFNNRPVAAMLERCRAAGPTRTTRRPRPARERGAAAPPAAPPGAGAGLPPVWPVLLLFAALYCQEEWK